VVQGSPRFPGCVSQTVKYKYVKTSCGCEWVKWLSFYVRHCWYLIMLYFVLGHDEGYDELASALGQVQGVLVGVVIYQSFVCSTPASENVSNLHVMGFPCDDISVPLFLPKPEYIRIRNHKRTLPMNI